MAHMIDMAPLVAPASAYANGRKVGDQVKFPDTPVFAGMNKPSRFEGDVYDLEFEGTIPPEISGIFYRVQPDHRFPPLYESEIHFSGDGGVTAIRIDKGHADLKQRYVMTDRLIAETKARRALFGRYRNPFTDNEEVKGVIRTVANTNITFWRGVLLASKEDGPPFAMDPDTLETIGRWDFDGQITAPTFTAHPKFDPKTGEMVCFAYEAGGDGADGSCDVVVWTFNAEGRKTEEAWYKAPWCGMIHDCGLSENYLVLPMTPIKCNMDRVRAGGAHWAWDPTSDQLYGVVPRRGGKPEDIKWFHAPNAFHGHVAGCFEDDEGRVVFDLTNADGNVFFFFPEDGKPAVPTKFSSPTQRWVFDPKAPSGTKVTPTEVLTDLNGEFSRIDDRWITRRYTHFWQLQVDPSRPYDFAKCGPPVGGLFNVLGHFTWGDPSTNTPAVRDVYFAGPTSTFQEPTFIPKPGSEVEGEGWIILLVNRLDELRNDVAIFDALDVAKGPVATLKLPLKLKLGLHGNWVDESDLEAWRVRRREGGEVGPAKAAEGKMIWQEKFEEERRKGKTNGTNGVNGYS